MLTQPCLVSRPIPGVVPNHLQVLHTTGLSQLFEEVGVLETLRQDVQDLKLVLPSNGRDRVSVNHLAGPRGVRGGETSRCFFFWCVFFRCFSGSWSEKPGGMAPPQRPVFSQGRIPIQVDTMGTSDAVGVLAPTAWSAQTRHGRHSLLLAEEEQFHGGPAMSRSLSVPGRSKNLCLFELGRQLGGHGVRHRKLPAWSCSFAGSWWI